MKGFRSILNEFWNGTIEEVKKPTAKIIKSDWFHERPKSVTFQRLLEYHDLTPQIQIAVSSYSELITGTEMTIQSEDQGATDFLKEWIRKTNFYDKLEGLVTTVLICGNGLLEKLSASNIEDVMEVDMTSIISKKRNLEGELLYYEQRQDQGKIVELHNIDDFIELNLTNYSRQAWGRSLFYSLAVPRTTGFRTTAPLVEVMWGIEDAMAGILQNNAFPITTITYPGANDEYLEKEAERWRRYKPGDKRVQKIKPEIEFFEAQGGQGKYQFITEHLEKTMEIGTQFPHDIMTGDFTSRASSETTETIVMKRVRGYQHYLCNKLKKELFEPILEQNGFNTQDIELEISFTTQNIVELEPDKVLSLFTSGVITIKEIRDWYQANTGMDMEESELKALVDKKEQDKNDEMEMQKKAMEQPKEPPKKEPSSKEKESILAESLMDKQLKIQANQFLKSIREKKKDYYDV